ncbi:type II toxin-antitoxin system Phd/YefM family antitoxin [Nostoc sp. FACHB-888]|uniref:type II toxin-antitoxin system Phd/YefM family antitoxin n=1 Tax=Nostoc sp. FACHB-888 TaxID=2692842 RepID=UPI00168305B2|nr:type II toxin-antitoxin system Phd/YefM family antitoxin [Nostoc sp. FACHB-888]MBD2245829.1 type II toxin-antitoxin system Phd/YefM family antitoxin [Nostoc sp. FACHB-888]
METVNIHQAKTNLSKLLSRVELGEEIIISNRGIPVAKLVPFRSSSNRLNSLGQDKGRFVVPDHFNAPLPEEILAAFEGGEE